MSEFSVEVNSVQGDDKMLSTLKTTPDFLGRVLLVPPAFFLGADVVEVLLEGITSPLREGSFGSGAELWAVATADDDDDDDPDRLTRVCEL